LPVLTSYDIRYTEACQSKEGTFIGDTHGAGMASHRAVYVGQEEYHEEESQPDNDSIAWNIEVPKFAFNNKLSKKLHLKTTSSSTDS